MRRLEGRSPAGLAVEERTQQEWPSQRRSSRARGQTHGTGGSRDRVCQETSPAITSRDFAAHQPIQYYWYGFDKPCHNGVSPQC